MKNKIKKFLSFIIVGILVQNNSFAFAAISYEPTEADYSTVKIEKLGKLNTKLGTYINKEIKKSIAGIKNVADKKSFNEELYVINELNKDLQSNLKYAYDAQFDENFVKLRNQARSFVQLKKDITSLTASGINVYSITPEDKANVEKNIIDMQSYYVGIIKDVIKEIDTKNDIKETGAGKFEIISNVGKITLSIDKYTNILSMLSGNQEMDYNITLGIDIKKDEKLNIPFDIVGTANFKVNLKKIGDDLYITLSDYSISFDGIKDMTKVYDDMLAPYKGKTVHMSTKSTIDQGIAMNPNTELQNFKSVLDIVSKESVLTPLKKKDNGFILTTNTQTLTDIGAIFGQIYTKDDIVSSRKALSSLPLLYTETNGNPKISSEIIDKGNELRLNIEKKGADYGIEYSYKGTTNGQDSEVYVYLQKALYKVNITTPEAIVKFGLENRIFDLLITANKQEFAVKGTYDDLATDLKILFNSKEIGKIQTTKDAVGNYTYNFGLKITDFSQFGTEIPAELKDKTLEINITGNYLLEKGEFKIEKPASFIEIEDMKKLTPDGRDSIRLDDLNSLASGVEQYYQDTGAYPISLAKIVPDYITKIPVDVNDGKTSSGCKFGYNYEVKTDSEGAKNGAYRLSACLENQTNDSLKYDGGVDDTKYELGYELDIFKK